MFRKYLLPLLAVAGMAFAVRSVVLSNRQTPAAPPPAQPAEGPYAMKVAGSGLVEANTQNIEVGTPLPGLVTSVRVVADNDVRTGDVLFQLDDRNLQAERQVRQAALRAANERLAKLLKQPRPEDLPPAQAKVDTAAAELADAQSQWETADRLRDTNAISREDLARRRFALQAAKARLAQAEADLALLKAGAWAPDVEIARADVASAEAQLRSIETDIDRLVVRSPADGKILQVNVRAGEYASAGMTSLPLILMGNVSPLYVRTNVDENDAWRVRPGARAIAYVRGKPDLSVPLQFVRIEPYVVPKKSLTGDTAERIDTRVLQVLYAFDRGNLPIYPGQQMDVFIDAPHEVAMMPAPGATQTTAGTGNAEGAHR